jgi:hypothetical protein
VTGVDGVKGMDGVRGVNRVRGVNLLSTREARPPLITVTSVDIGSKHTIHCGQGTATVLTSRIASGFATVRASPTQLTPTPLRNIICEGE